MPIFDANQEKQQKVLDDLTRDLQEKSAEYESVQTQLDVYEDPRWEWACENVIADELNRVARERCRIDATDTIRGAQVTGQFNECNILIERAAQLKRQRDTLADELSSIRGRISKISSEARGRKAS